MLTALGLIAIAAKPPGQILFISWTITVSVLAR
jgi:hypothetical protein